MSEQTTTPEAPTASTTTTVPDLHAYAEEQAAARAERQAEAEQAALDGPAKALSDMAKRERATFDEATKPTRDANGYVEKYAAYDTRRLAFVEGAIGDSAKAARDAAKALGHEGDHIETRKV